MSLPNGTMPANEDSISPPNPFINDAAVISSSSFLYFFIFPRSRFQSIVMPENTAAEITSAEMLFAMLRFAVCTAACASLICSAAAGSVPAASFTALSCRSFARRFAIASYAMFRFCIGCVLNMARFCSRVSFSRRSCGRSMVV